MKLHIDSEVNPPYKEIAFLRIERKPAGEDFYLIGSPDNRLDGEYITPLVETHPFKYVYNVRVSINTIKGQDYDMPDTYLMVLPDDCSPADEKEYLESVVRNNFRVCWTPDDFRLWLIEETEKALSFCEKVASL